MRTGWVNWNFLVWNRSRAPVILALICLLNRFVCGWDAKLSKITIWTKYPINLDHGVFKDSFAVIIVRERQWLWLQALSGLTISAFDRVDTAQQPQEASAPGLIRYAESATEDVGSLCRSQGSKELRLCSAVARPPSFWGRSELTDRSRV